MKRETQARDRQQGDEIRYICQATQLPYFTTPLRWWDMRQYLEDLYLGKHHIGTYVSWFSLCQLLSPCSGLEAWTGWSPFPLALRSLSSRLGRPPFPQKEGDLIRWPTGSNGLTEFAAR